MSERALTRTDELLADGALGWLAADDDAELAAVLRTPAARAELASLERVAAVAARAFVEPPGEQQQRLVGLTAKLHAAALECLRCPPVPHRPAVGDGDAGSGVRAARAAGRNVLPWLLAAAMAVVALAVHRSDRALPATDARAALLRAREGVVTCAWEPGPSPRRGDVRGDVVWAVSRQEGFLRVQGLPALDAAHRYQLWIVDAARDGPPVDGGLLPPLPGAGETVVPIAARLPVQRAAAFVLTVERAHGAVVSAQEHVVAIARP
jgi:hypothetical protein